MVHTACPTARDRYLHTRKVTCVNTVIMDSPLCSLVNLDPHVEVVSSVILPRRQISCRSEMRVERHHGV